MRRSALAVVAVVATLAATEAHAVRFELGAGGGAWFTTTGLFDVTLGVRQHLARHLALGFRTGVLLTTDGPAVGTPLDLSFRVVVHPVYFEVLGGPTFIFNQGSPLRGHVAFGFGGYLGPVTLGVEVGYLTPTAVVMLQLAYAF